MPALNGPQFTRETRALRGPTSYRSFDYGEDPGKSTYASYEETIRGPAYKTSYAYGRGPFKTSALAQVRYSGGVQHARYPHNEHTPAWANETAEPSGQVPLFTLTPSNARSTVTTLTSTKGARIPAMTLLGIADIDSRRRYGIGLDSSDNLSQHSENLVGRLSEAGEVTKPSEITRNSWTFLEHPTSSGVDGDVLSQGEVALGRSRVRSVLRKRDGGPTQEPPEQLRMDI